MTMSVIAKQSWRDTDRKFEQDFAEYFRTHPGKKPKSMLSSISGKFSGLMREHINNNPPPWRTAIRTYEAFRDYCVPDSIIGEERKWRVAMVKWFYKRVIPNHPEIDWEPLKAGGSDA